MATVAHSSEHGNTKQPADSLEDGPVKGALLPLMRINGKLYVVPNTLHFYSPTVADRPTKPMTDGRSHAGASNE